YGEDFVKQLSTGKVDQEMAIGFDQRAEKDARDEPKYALATFNYAHPQYDEFPTGAPAPGFPDVYNQTHARFTGIYISDIVDFWDHRIRLMGGLRYNDYLQ